MNMYKYLLLYIKKTEDYGWYLVKIPCEEWQKIHPLLENHNDKVPRQNPHKDEDYIDDDHYYYHVKALDLHNFLSKTKNRKLEYITKDCIDSTTLKKEDLYTEENENEFSKYYNDYTNEIILMLSTDMIKHISKYILGPHRILVWTYRGGSDKSKIVGQKSLDFQDIIERITENTNSFGKRHARRCNRRSKTKKQKSKKQKSKKQKSKKQKSKKQKSKKQKSKTRRNKSK